MGSASAMRITVKWSMSWPVVFTVTEHAKVEDIVVSEGISIQNAVLSIAKGNCVDSYDVSGGFGSE